MATHDIPILGAFTTPDSTGEVFFEPAEVALDLGTAVFDTLPVITMLAPTGSNIGIYGKFGIPQNYVGTPVLVVRGVIGENANVLGFGLQQLGRADSEAFDTVLEPEDVTGLSNSTWTGYAAEDMFEISGAITPGAAYEAGDEVFYFFFRDDGVDDQTGAFHLTGLFFRYNDA